MNDARSPDKVNLRHGTPDLVNLFTSSSEALEEGVIPTGAVTRIETKQGRGKR